MKKSTKYQILSYIILFVGICLCNVFGALTIAQAIIIGAIHGLTFQFGSMYALNRIEEDDEI